MYLWDDHSKKPLKETKHFQTACEYHRYFFGICLFDAWQNIFLQIVFFHDDLHLMGSQSEKKHLQLEGQET